MLNTIKGHGLTVVTNDEDSTVTITGTKENIQNYVLKDTGLFNALRKVPNFKEATFKVNSADVIGKLLPTKEATTATNLWTNLSAKNTTAVNASGATEVTNTITVVNNAGTTAIFNVVMKIVTPSAP